MPPLNPILDPGDGSGNSSPYFYLLLNNNSQNLVWNAANSQPLANIFSLTLQYYLITSPSIAYDIYFSEPVAPWLEIGGPSVSGDFITVSGGTNKNISIQLIGIDLLPNGVYNSEIVFTASGTSNGVVNTYDIVSYFVTLTIFNNSSASITVDKNQYNVFFNRQTGILSGDTVVNVLNNTEPLSLNFIANNFVTKNNVINNFDIEEFNIASNLNLPNQGTVNINGGLFKVDNSQIANVNIALTLGINSDLFVDKSFINFQINKATPQTANSSLYLTNPEDKSYAITVPSWLTLSQNNGSTSGYITVTTVSSSTLPGGDYSGDIVITYDNKSISIPVFLQVISFMSFNPGNNNFCKDIPSIIFNRMNATARILRIKMSAKFNLQGIETIKENVYAIPYVADKAVFNFGDKVNNQFPRRKLHFFDIPDNFLLMKNAVVDLVCEELDSNYNLLLSETLTNVKLFPGSRPSGFPLLSNNLFRKKNKGSVFFNSKVVGEEIKIEKVENTDNIDELDFGSTVVKYYNFPKYYNIISVHFENDNLSPEWFTLTGEFKMTSEFTHIYANNIFKSQNEKYDFSKVKMLNVNTGFFLKNELLLVEKLVESKLAYIKISDKIYRCFSTTQKLILDDSSEELLNRDLDFLIVEM
ncbi:hypothetical protein [Chryseobacterium sp. Hurlbut01]|uniref:hypothetical protein n=1 Tax=Chryseobacterium sp. Hurlbut01 TaxID=1681828 RepID=UPI00067D6F3F|nr:hypothetical protein [Chryseobacterium sp. Hurlbut01]KNB60964.1 hypothetical protein AC804_17620 [Chryseobacterium sp. Hurlbut01]